MTVPAFAPVTPTNTQESVEQFSNGVTESHQVTEVPHTAPITNETTPVTNSSGQQFTAEDLNKVREQEKAKLYPEIDRLKNELKTVQEQLSSRAQEEAEARAKAEAEARAKAEAEMDVRELLKAKESEWETRFTQQAEQIAAEKAERERAQQLFQLEQQYSELQAYRQQRLDAAADQIMPELRDLVTGNTVEEVEASIQNLIDRTARIVDNVKQATQSARQQQPGARVTYPANGPLDTDSNNQSFTPEQLAAMDISEYSKHRARLLGSSSSSRGMFG